MKKQKKYERKLSSNISHNFSDYFLNVFFSPKALNPYDGANVEISRIQPQRKRSFKVLTSPIFLIDEGFKFNVQKRFNISFLFSDSPLNIINHLKSLGESPITTFFSIGLASVIVVHELEDNELKKILSNYYSLIKESWEVDNGKIVKSNILPFINENSNEHISFINLPEKIPGDISFLIREFQKTSNEVLDKAEEYSPYTYKKIKKLINHFAKGVLTDLFFILDDSKEYPDSELYQELKEYSKNKEDLIVKKNELKSDSISLLVQIYSSLNYINNQYFSGISPILKNSGQIIEYNLLGVGSAVRGLFIMLDNLEIFLTSTKLETLSDEKLLSKKFNGLNTLGFNQTSSHDPEKWRMDKSFESYQLEIAQIEKQETEFSRVGYFSARLGFKEYRYFATSAVQVLVAASSNEWSLVNYTHEIIHGHVRYLLQHIIEGSNLAEIHEEWMELTDDINYLKKKEYNVKELGQIVIADYFDSCDKMGSLSKSLKGTKNLNQDYSSYSPIELDNRMNDSYWEINELFVHSLDFFYIYKSNYDIYIRSIWLSWITQPVVSKDPSQYILRSLLVISLKIPGIPKVRYEQALVELNSIFKDLVSKSSIFNQFIGELNLFEKESVSFLRYFNCLTVADFAFQFMTSPNTERLVNNDINVFEEPGDFHDCDVPFIYDTNINDWPYTPVHSKFYYILESCHKSIIGKIEPHDYRYASSKLLTVISSL